MKYENKKQVDILCDDIRNRVRELDTVETSTVLSIGDNNFNLVYQNVTDADKEDLIDDPRNKAAFEYKVKLAEIIQQEITALKKELEKL